MKSLSFTVLYGTKDITSWVFLYVGVSFIPDVYIGIKYIIRDSIWIVEKIVDVLF